MKSLRRYWMYLIVAALLFVVWGKSTVPLPESVIGFAPGSDYKMANWEQIYTYFRDVDKASDRVEVIELGKTEMDRPMIAAFISSPANLHNKEKIKEIQKKLAHPQLTSDAELPKLVKDGKAIVLVSCSLHSTELGATQMSPILVYQLATENNPVVKEILDNVIVVLFPSSNPDGVQMTAEYYMKQNPRPGVNVASLPRLYNKYTGHDDNRDWYMLTQKESKIIAKQMYEEWFPEIIYDLHQKGGGARFTFPPYDEPVNPIIHPQVVRELELLGGYMTVDLIAGGYPWVEDHTGFDMWWHGGMRTAPYFHNMVGILSEAASANLASPQIPSEGQINQAKQQPKPAPTINYPVKWIDDRKWTLDNIVEEERLAVFAILKAAARNKDMFLTNYYMMNKDAIEKGKTEKPFAYVLPIEQQDHGAMVYFLDIMLRQDTEVCRATKEFTAGGKKYSPGSIIVYLSQPARPHILAIMEPQIYPSGRRPYDITGWTLPLQMGVLYDKVDEPFTAVAEPYRKAVPVSKEITQKSPAVFYIDGNSVDHYQALNRLFKKNYKPAIITQSYTVNSVALPLGSLVLENQGTIASDIAELKKEFSLTVIESNAPDNSKKVQLTAPRIGVIESPNSAPVGWLKWLLDKYEYKYTLIDTSDILKGDLRSQYDVLLCLAFPPGAVVETGAQGGGGGRRAQNVDPSIAAQRLARQQKIQNELQKFINQGGTIVSWDNAIIDCIRIFDLKISDATPQRSETAPFSIPGSILKINVDTSHPVTYGLQKETYVMFGGNRILKVDNGKVLGYYPDSNPLVSGFLQGAEYIQNTPCIITDTIGSGKVVIISFDATFRAQPVGTYKLIFNSILYSVMPAVN